MSPRIGSLCLVVVLAAACHGSSAPSIADAPPAPPITFSPSTSQVAPYQVLVLESSAALTGKTVTVELAGMAATASVVGPANLTVLIPDLAPEQASLTIAVDGVAAPAIVLSIEASPPIADPVASVHAELDAATAALDQLAEASPPAEVVAAIAASRTNLASARTKFDAVPSEIQVLVARFLAANVPQAPSAQLQFDIPAQWRRDASHFLAAAIVTSIAGGAVYGGVAAAAVLGAPLAAALILGGAIVMSVTAPEMMADAIALATEVGPIDGNLSSTDPLRIRPTAATEHFRSDHAQLVSLVGKYRALEAADVASDDALVRETAQAFVGLGDAFATVNPELAAPYTAPSFASTPSQSTTVLGQYLAAQIVDGSGVTVAASTARDDGIALTLHGPGSCTELALSITYDDHLSASQVVTVPADVDCETVVQFEITSLTPPTTNAMSAADGIDLNGDATADNLYGEDLSTATSNGCTPVAVATTGVFGEIDVAGTDARLRLFASPDGAGPASTDVTAANAGSASHTWTGGAKLSLQIPGFAGPLHVDLIGVALRGTISNGALASAVLGGAIPADEVTSVIEPAFCACESAANPTQWSQTCGAQCHDCAIVQSLFQPDVTIAGTPALSTGFAFVAAPASF